MLRATALVWVIIALQGAAVADEAKPDTVQVHGKALQLSCAEWSRNADGSWTNVGPLLVGEETVKEVTLRGANAKVLEQKCANGAAPSAAPSPSGEPKPHRHRHGPAAPAEGT